MKQKIAICSDLHIDTYGEAGHHWTIPSIPDEKDTILVVAGDVCEVRLMHYYREFFVDVNDRFLHVLYVLGNHEYYGSDFLTVAGNAKAALGDLPNITILDNESIQIDDIHFVGTTLWTDILGHDMKFVKDMMNDYNSITCGGKNHQLTPGITNHKHAENVQFLDREIDPLKKTVLITHHLPSPKCVHSMYLGNRLNTAFVGDISDRLSLLKPVLAIHGHTHTDVDFVEDGVRYLCNPRGYPNENGSEYILRLVEV